MKRNNRIRRILNRLFCFWLEHRLISAGRIAREMEAACQFMFPGQLKPETEQARYYRLGYLKAFWQIASRLGIPCDRIIGIGIWER